MCDKANPKCDKANLKCDKANLTCDKANLKCDTGVPFSKRARRPIAAAEGWYSESELNFRGIPESWLLGNGDCGEFHDSHLQNSEKLRFDQCLPIRQNTLYPPTNLPQRGFRKEPLIN